MFGEKFCEFCNSAMDMLLAFNSAKYDHFWVCSQLAPFFFLTFPAYVMQKLGKVIASNDFTLCTNDVTCPFWHR